MVGSKGVLATCLRVQTRITQWPDTIASKSHLIALESHFAVESHLNRIQIAFKSHFAFGTQLQQKCDFSRERIPLEPQMQKTANKCDLNPNKCDLNPKKSDSQMRIPRGKIRNLSATWRSTPGLPTKILSHLVTTCAIITREAKTS